MSTTASEFGFCDLCEDLGIATPAVADRHLHGGVYASLCEAHAYRLDSAERARAALAADSELADVAALILDSLPRPSRVPNVALENARAVLAWRTPR